MNMMLICIKSINVSFLFLKYKGNIGYNEQLSENKNSSHLHT
jgi:hypothetical protein